MIIAVISIAPYVPDKGENTALQMEGTIYNDAGRALFIMTPEGTIYYYANFSSLTHNKYAQRFNFFNSKYPVAKSFPVLANGGLLQ